MRKAAGSIALVVALLGGCTTSPGSEEPADATTGGAGVDDMATHATAVVGDRVNPALFGMHVGDLGSGGQPVPRRAGAIRLWDAGVAWRQLEPVPGRIDWTALDRAVAQAQSAGAAEILWVHGSPPQWAARTPDAAGLYGPGTSSAPQEGPYLDILRKVAQRYRGRITAYQAWNEANLRIFYRGKVDYLADLTAQAHELLAEVDPDALLVGASTTVRAAGPVKAWYGRYAEALADRGWPVDAMAVHLYPLAQDGPDARVGYVRTMRAWLADRGWTGPMWDTEVSFGDRRDFAETKVEVPQDVATGWVARTYLDSLALGVDRVYWYTWNNAILGIDLTDPHTGEVLSAGQAYLTLQEWLDGASWAGCTGELIAPTGERGAVTTCEVTQADGTAGRIVYTLTGRTTLTTPAGASDVCRLDGSCAPAGVDGIVVTPEPVLIRFGD